MAGKTVSSFAELNKLLKEKIAEAMVKEGKFLEEKVKENVDEVVYSYSQKVYERTGQLRDSLYAKTPKIKNQTIEVEVKHNTDLIESTPPNQHYSVVDSYSRKDVSDWMPYIVIGGHSGDVFGEGAWTQRRDYIQKTKDDLRSSGEHVDKLVRYLREVGLNAKKG